MFALLAMAGDLGGSIGPAIVGRVTQNTGNNIRAGMGIGLIFPTALLIMLFIFSRTKNRNCIKKFYKSVENVSVLEEQAPIEAIAEAAAAK